MQFYGLVMSAAVVTHTPRVNITIRPMRWLLIMLKEQHGNLWRIILWEEHHRATCDRQSHWLLVILRTEEPARNGCNSAPPPSSTESIYPCQDTAICAVSKELVGDDNASCNRMVIPFWDQSIMVTGFCGDKLLTTPTPGPGGSLQNMDLPALRVPLILWRLM